MVKFICDGWKSFIACPFEFILGRAAYRAIGQMSRDIRM